MTGWHTGRHIALGRRVSGGVGRVRLALGVLVAAGVGAAASARVTIVATNA